MNQPMSKMQELTDQWKTTKAALVAAQNAHLQSEIDIFNAVKDQLPAKGTTSFDTGLKIVTGFTEKWDQGKLADAYNTWDAPVPFPFKNELKPDGKALTYLKENAPALWKQLQAALTLTEKKPAFSLKGEE